MWKNIDTRKLVDGDNRNKRRVAFTLEKATLAQLSEIAKKEGITSLSRTIDLITVFYSANKLAMQLPVNPEMKGRFLMACLKAKKDPIKVLQSYIVTVASNGLK